MQNASAPLTIRRDASSAAHPGSRAHGASERPFFAGLGAKIAAMNQAGVDVIRLDEGSPDLPPAPHIIQALAESAARPDTHGYQPHRGSRCAAPGLGRDLPQVHQVELDPDSEILPLLGSKEGIFHLSQALIDPGDVVLIPDPGYITYTRGALFAGAEPYNLPLLAENGYLPDLAAIPPEITPPGQTAVAELSEQPHGGRGQPGIFCRRRWTLPDSTTSAAVPRRGLRPVTFDGQPAPSLLHAPGAKEVAVEFNTLSKSHNMAGWRAGAGWATPRCSKPCLPSKPTPTAGISARSWMPRSQP